MKQLHVIFRGRVQGVGFRFNTQMIARSFPVTGFVRNLQDGTVELAAEGEETILQNFLKAIRESRLSHNIEELNADWKDAAGSWKHFSIK